MSRLTAAAVGACACAYPLFAHAAAIRAEPAWVAVGIALLTWAVAAVRVSAVISLSAGLLALGLGLTLASLAPAAMLFAPPVALNVFLCAVFAATLRPRHEPLIARFARLERGADLPPDLARYTRILTGCWVVFFALMAALSLALALWASITAWSVFTNLVNYVLVGLFFIGEYAYRRLRYRHYDHATPLELARLIRARGVFPRANGG
jgi:uncharacterized membrane protein